MDRTQLKSLYPKLVSKEISNEELDALLAYFQTGDLQELHLLIREELHLPVREELDAEEAEISYSEESVMMGQRVLEDLKAEIAKGRVVKVKLWPRIAAVAAAVAAITLCIWIYNHKEIASVPRNDDFAQQDIAPGRNGATLTLANGKVIQLSDAKSGVVVGVDKITYSDGTEIASEAAQPRNDDRSNDSSLRGSDPSLRGGTTKQSHDEIATIPRNDVMQMVAATAKGQTYTFVLPDGTKVWLNADSKLSFPSQFIGKDRKVLLEGEAYFAVLHSDKQVFKVESAGQVVEDIGTEFNIKAYADESSITTTLAEGIARVSTKSVASTKAKAAGSSVTLKPGQQSALSPANQLSVRKVDLEKELDWKNGDFVIEDEPFRSLMRRVARWYNIEVVYAPGAPEDLDLLGMVSRSKNVSAVLKLMEATGKVRFNIQGRTVTVLPNK